MTDDASPLRIFLVWFIYLLPAILVILTNCFNDRERYWKMRSIKAAVYVNLLLGWTIIGWFWAWRFVWYRPEGLVPLNAAAGGGSPSGSGPAAPANTAWPPSDSMSSGPQLCSACNGNGRVTCGACRGQGGEWRQPQSASGTSEFVSCGYCLRSGTITCGSCGGRGRV